MKTLSAIIVDDEKGPRERLAVLLSKIEEVKILGIEEDPELIIQEMEAGVGVVHKKKTISVLNRYDAIKTACMLAKPNDIILIAGKGHENYQDIKGVKHPFDDKITIAELFKTLGL